MKTSAFASLIFLAPLALVGCVQEGHSADCELQPGGASYQELAEDGCLTPIGGSCLSEDAFKENRPAKHEDSSGDERTVDDDWISYQYERPDCEFECLTEEEFFDNRTEDPKRTVDGDEKRISLEEDYDLYLELRPECE